MQVRRISQVVLKREHTFIDTVGLGSVETHDKVYSIVELQLIPFMEIL